MKRWRKNKKASDISQHLCSPEENDRAPLGFLQHDDLDFMPASTETKINVGEIEVVWQTYFFNLRRRQKRQNNVWKKQYTREGCVFS